MVKKYEDGIFVIVRLVFVDYYRFYFLVDGEILEIKKILGYYYFVLIYVIKINFRIFCENKREYVILKIEKFGDIVMFDIGVIMVGGIV